jgi:hypothetical protein
MKAVNINILIIGLLALLIVSFSLYQYVFSIYEVTYTENPEKLFADNQSTITIKAIPINSFGWKAPFRNAYAKFEITEGSDLVNIVSGKNRTDSLILQAKNKIGKVVVLIHSEYALLPSSIEITIYPNFA